MKKALLLGASGIVGSSVLLELLADPACGQVTAVVRKDLVIANPECRVFYTR